MGVRITDTTLRDAHQSLLATRMRPSFVILRSEATKNLAAGLRQHISAVAPHHQILRCAQNDTRKNPWA